MVQLTQISVFATIFASSFAAVVPSYTATTIASYTPNSFTSLEVPLATYGATVKYTDKGEVQLIYGPGDENDVSKRGVCIGVYKDGCCVGIYCELKRRDGLDAPTFREVAIKRPDERIPNYVIVHPDLTADLVYADGETISGDYASII